MKGYEELETEIIRAGRCTVCGACISACPLYYVALVNGMPSRPRKKAACKECGVCYNACYLTKDGKDEGKAAGDFIRVVCAMMGDEKERRSCQDGGAVTAVIDHALGHGLIDGALLTGHPGWKPEPIIAKSKEEIASSSKFETKPVSMGICSVSIKTMSICILTQDRGVGRIFKLILF